MLFAAEAPAPREARAVASGSGSERRQLWPRWASKKAVALCNPGGARCSWKKRTPSCDMALTWRRRGVTLQTSTHITACPSTVPGRHSGSSAGAASAAASSAA
eukprot:12138069-Alexandrium_andersonii.AAC.1